MGSGSSKSKKKDDKKKKGKVSQTQPSRTAPGHLPLHLPFRSAIDATLSGRNLIFRGFIFIRFLLQSCEVAHHSVVFDVTRLYQNQRGNEKNKWLIFSTFPYEITLQSWPAGVIARTVTPGRE